MKKIKRQLLSYIILISSVLIFAGCTKTKIEPTTRTELWLDTPCTITVYDKVSGQTMDKAFNVLKDIHNKMNANSDTSEVSAVNKNAGIDYVKVSDETFYVLQQAVKDSELTKGYFDITVGPLVKMWGINTENARVPAPEEITAALPLINYRNIALDEKNKSVLLKNKGMAIDLGGIAKGYAADAVAKALKQDGIQHAIINLGGNVFTMGSKVDGTSWKIGIQNPSTSSERGEYIGLVEVKDKAVVTSGIYERYFEKDGKIYHHIFDTSTGYPVDNELASVTIVTDLSVSADALAKAFCMGLDNGSKFIESLQGVEAIFVTKNKEVYATPGLVNSFKLTSTDYKLISK